MKVWITKYALTTGVYTEDAEESDSSDNVICVKKPGIMLHCFHGNDWHDTEKAAIARAEEMRAKKLVSLKKQFKKIESLTFK